MKNYLIWGVALVVIIGAGYWLYKAQTSGPTQLTPLTPTQQNATSTQGANNERLEQIGTSVEGRPIEAYHFGEGDTEILFVGGIHGGYSWGTTLLAYELIKYLDANPQVVPANERITVIPALNPDGLNKVVGTTSPFVAADVKATAAVQAEGRFNANKVDLSRNFDCEWKPTGVWQNKTVSGGTAAFSEPESKAIQSYVESNKPDAVVVWYSAAGGVFASSCRNGVSQETTALTKLYADASGYKAYQSFDFYAITGDMVNWLAKQNVPAISVLLTTHGGVEWDKNRAGIEAVLKEYAQ